MKQFIDYRAAYLIFTFMAMFQLSACETLGNYENVDTTRKSILVANAELKGANLLLQDLLRRRVIGTNAAQTALDSLNDAHDALQAALNAVDVAGDPIRGANRLDTANRAITVALVLLSAYTGSPASGPEGEPQ